MVYPGIEAFGSFDAWINAADQLKFLQINHFPLIVGLWNLLIIIVPFLTGKWLMSLAQKGEWRITSWRFWLTGIIWILFIPNTAYLIVDIRHLDGFCPASTDFYRICDTGAWYIPFFFIFGAIGWWALVMLVGQVATAARLAWGRFASLVLEMIVLPLIALGVLMGMLDRWNSWQAVLDLPGVWASALSFINNPLRLRDWIVYTVVFYLLYFGGHAILRRGSARG